MNNKDGRIRKNVTLGSTVQIVMKQDQNSGFLTKGTVVEILTDATKHAHGIKVRLKSGKIGRIKKILHVNQDAPEEFPVEDRKNKEKEIILPWER